MEVQHFQEKPSMLVAEDGLQAGNVCTPVGEEPHVKISDDMLLDAVVFFTFARELYVNIN